MTPKRLRLIALCIRRGIQAHTASTEALAQELEEHATEWEDLQRGTRREVKLREPGTSHEIFDPSRGPTTARGNETVFGDIKRTFPKASEGMR